MKKVKKFLKSNMKFVLGIIIGAVLSGTTVFATAMIYSSDQLSYDNTISGLTSIDAQGALDELYTRAVNCTKIKDNTVYFALGEPTTSSTTDYTTLNKNVFVAKNGDQKSVCMIRNNKLNCFDNNNFAIEKEHIQYVFSDISCEIGSGVICSASDFECYVQANGDVSCYYLGSGYNYCRIRDGSVTCH